jgi:hypothetical protein
VGSWRSRGAHRACRAWRRGPMRPRTACTAAHPAAKCDSRECYSKAKRARSWFALSGCIKERRHASASRDGSPHGSTSIGLITIFTRKITSRGGAPYTGVGAQEPNRSALQQRRGGCLGTGPISRTEQKISLVIEIVSLSSFVVRTTPNAKKARRTELTCLPPNIHQHPHAGVSHHARLSTLVSRLTMTRRSKSRAHVADTHTARGPHSHALITRLEGSPQCTDSSGQPTSRLTRDS